MTSCWQLALCIYENIYAILAWVFGQFSHFWLPVGIVGVGYLTSEDLMSRWFASFLLIIGWNLALGPKTLKLTLSRMSRHWFPLMLFLVVCLIASGNIGTGFGIQQIFHDDPEIGFNRNSPAFWGSFGVILFIGEIWTIVYLVEYITNYNHLSSAPRLQSWEQPGL